MMAWSKERQQLERQIKNLVEQNGEIRRALYDDIIPRVEQLEAARQEEASGDDDSNE